MNYIWFIKPKARRIPVNAIGITIALLAVICLVPNYATIVRNDHSGSENRPDIRFHNVYYILVEMDNK